MTFLFQNPESALSRIVPVAPARRRRGSSSSTKRGALRVRLTLAQAHVQDFAGVCACREDRVVAQLVGVAVAGALLGVAVNLTDEAVDVDGQQLVAGAGAQSPRAAQRDGEDPVELTNVPERKRAQERPQATRGAARDVPSPSCRPCWP